MSFLQEMFSDYDNNSFDPDSHPKRPRVSVGCIIHCTNDDEKLVSPQSVESWNTLVRAAWIRKHSPILQLAAETTGGDIPEVYYHRRCRSSSIKYKLKHPNLRAFQQEISALVQFPTLRTYAAKCTFCDKTSKYARKQYQGTTGNV